MKKLLKSKTKAFLNYLENVRGYSDLTIKSYDEVLTQALQTIEIIQSNKQIVLNLMPYRLKISHLNPKTISKKLSAIRSFSSYLNQNDMNVVLQADDSIKIAKTLPKPVSHKYIMEALVLSNQHENLVVTKLNTLGLRISELCSLELKDISLGWIRIIGKGNKQRDIPLLENVKELIDDYLNKNPKKMFLFELNDKRLSENSLRYTVNKVFKRIGLKVSPHQLRHSYATELLNNSASISDVSELLGHSSMSTTQIYTKLGSALKQQNYNKAHPLLSKSDLDVC